MGYIGPNGIPEDVPERAPEDETVTRGRPYNFVVLNSLVTGHLGKRIIIPNGETNSDETYGVVTRTGKATLLKCFIHRGVLILDIS